ncbi:hypothetical protein [Streptomyces sp. AC550_RSS872]|uniref:hypothetical protein n=1 Tax=Streptomyces sp. AC550_RSS872 TaxID=2823689 RepID=UPI001C254E88|nr:hypothetical protein [Streptomyces sp. AC550_RSS872]
MSGALGAVLALHMLYQDLSRHVSIQVLLLGKCGGLALNGSFVLLETADNERFAFVEGPETSVLHADADGNSTRASRRSIRART